MQKPSKGEFNPYYERYIELVPEGDFMSILNQNTSDITAFFQQIPSDKHDFRYAEGKWTIKEVLMHMIDTERVMSYRALVASRFDTSPLPGFDENAYAAKVDVSARTLESLLEEFLAVRNATKHLFANMNEAQSSFLGTANSHVISARALGYISIGHTLHHINVVKERYL